MNINIKLIKIEPNGFRYTAISGATAPIVLPKIMPNNIIYGKIPRHAKIRVTKNTHTA